MIKRYHIFLVFIFTCCCFLSCEYNLEKENFVNVTPPDPHIEFQIELEDHMDTIFIYEETTLKYNINTLGLDLKPNSEFHLANDTWIIHRDSGELIITPPENSYRVDTLSLTFNTNTNTNSLAEQISAEGYTVSAQWVVVFETRNVPRITPQTRINKDGYLEVFWDKCHFRNFKSYEFRRESGKSAYSYEYLYPELTIVIDNADSISFIDSSYVGGRSYYSIRARTTTKSSSKSGVEINHKLPQLYCEYIAIDSLRIFWDKSIFNANYSVHEEIGYKKYTSYFSSGTSDTTINIPYALFEYAKSLFLSVFPQNEKYNYTGKQETTLTSPIMGIGVINPEKYGSFTSYCYNTLEKSLYMSSGREGYLNSYEGTTMSKKIGSYPSNIVFETLSTCEGTSRIVGFDEHISPSLLIFENNKLEDPQRINIKDDLNIHKEVVNNFFYDKHLQLLKNDRIAMANTETYYLIDTHNKTVLDSLKYENTLYYDSCPDRTHVSTSQDGQFMCYCIHNKLNVYSIGSDSIIFHSSDERAYNSIYFNPYNPSEIYLTLKNSNIMEVRNVSDFSLTRRYNLPKTLTIENIDPATGLLLLSNQIGSQKLYIYDMENEKVVFSCDFDGDGYAKVNGDAQVRLIDNILFSRLGGYMDITTYIE